MRWTDRDSIDIVQAYIPQRGRMFWHSKKVAKVLTIRYTLHSPEGMELAGHLSEFSENCNEGTDELKWAVEQIVEQKVDGKW